MHVHFYKEFTSLAITAAKYWPVGSHYNKVPPYYQVCTYALQDNLVPEDAELVNNTASFTRCTFTENSSPTGGSAVSLVSNSRIDQTLATTNFIDW